MSYISYLEKRPILAGYAALILGLGILCFLGYQEFFSNGGSKEWRKYSVQTVEMRVQTGRKGRKSTYYHFITDDDVEIKTSAKIAEAVDVNAISQLTFPQDMELYSTHEISTPLNGDRILWIDGVRGMAGELYLDPEKARELVSSDRKIGFILGFVFALCGLGIIVFANKLTRNQDEIAQD